MEVREPSAKCLVGAASKHTEVGQIPADWQVVALSVLSSKITDGTHGTPTPVQLGRPYLTAVHVKENAVAYESCLYLTEDDHKVIYSRCNPQRGDVLIVNIGAGVATTAVVNVDFEFSLKNVALLKPDTRKADGGFVNYALVKRKASIVQALSSGGAQPFLSLTQIGEIKIAVPPTKEEQQAIATSLSDADALIESLEQLLTKKRQIKQGAMQELLTAKRRLPGFEGEWELKPMRFLGATYGGLTGKSKVDFGHGKARYIPFMNVMSSIVIDPEWLELVDVSSTETQNATRAGDLFFNGSSETPEEVGFCSVLQQSIPDLYLNSFCFGFRFHADAKANGLFLAYWFRSKAGRKAMSLLAQGATRYNIAKSAFLMLEVPQPCEHEQTAIAAVLSDMDADIATLEAKLAKARAIKQGMMQELLTGRIRLGVAE